MLSNRSTAKEILSASVLLKETSLNERELLDGRQFISTYYAILVSKTISKDLSSKDLGAFHQEIII